MSLLTLSYSHAFLFYRFILENMGITIAFNLFSIFFSNLQHFIGGENSFFSQIIGATALFLNNTPEPRNIL